MEGCGDGTRIRLAGVHRDRASELSCSEGNSGDGTAAVDEVLPEVEAAYASQGVSQEIKEGCWWRNLFGDVNLLGV